MQIAENAKQPGVRLLRSPPDGAFGNPSGEVVHVSALLVVQMKDTRECVENRR